jgi:hypothetical protein
VVAPPGEIVATSAKVTSETNSSVMAT